MHPFLHPYLRTVTDQGEEDQELHLDLLKEAVVQRPRTEKDLHFPKSDQPTLHTLRTLEDYITILNQNLIRTGKCLNFLRVI